MASETEAGRRPPDPPDRDLIAVGEAAERTGQFAAAEEAYRAAATAATDPGHVGEALFRSGRVAWRQGRYDDALHLYARAREHAADVGLRARVENGVGAVHYSRGEYRQARACYQVALDLADNDALRGRILLNLGVLANIGGDLVEAQQQYARSRAAFEKARDDDGQALVLHNLAMLHADHQEWDEADDTYARCLVISERRDNRQMIANVLVNRSEVQCARGDPAAAAASCERAITIFREIGDEPGHGEALRWLGIAHHRSGSLDAADRALREATRIATRLRIALLEGEATRALGAVARDRGDIDAAVRWLRRALARFRALGARGDVSGVEAELADLGAVRPAGGSDDAVAEG